ncbi:hypothetical protein BpHYR1_027858 [Brachionus plicatilis]|uniref:Uncharacterized protein n=1 Tax=Brachionus plicatilis TaxID=10195 RepID=A0A3M7SAE7_BRAPC|nr:hypothetical protein BpHYR1_027858 [Brachionus plicatilis]
MKISDEKSCLMEYLVRSLRIYGYKIKRQKETNFIVTCRFKKCRNTRINLMIRIMSNEKWGKIHKTQGNLNKSSIGSILDESTMNRKDNFVEDSSSSSSSNSSISSSSNSSSNIEVLN